MKVSFYKYGSNLHGHFIPLQGIYDGTVQPEKTIDMTKKEFFQVADLRHPISTKNEFFQTLSTDIEGKPKKEWSICGHNHFLVIRR